MKIRFFYHSLISDWNHGNAHFLRGIVSELRRRRHDVRVYEPQEAWSVKHLLAQHGSAPLQRFGEVYPELKDLGVRYDPAALDVAAELADADLVIVHEWNDPELVRRIGELRRRRGARFRLLFHDTHHRLVTQPAAMRAYSLEHYDGVLAYGRVLAELYRRGGLARRVWTWHEAADTQRFTPQRRGPKEGDLVWIGNWGDGERTEELHEFLINPVRALGLKATFYGVRYPEEARIALHAAGIEYRGWLPNFEVPQVFSRYRLTVHVPRRPYVRALPGIPTIRPFEALACGIPLVCSPWEDAENLFTAGRDYLVAHNGEAMQAHLAHLLAHPRARQQLSAHGLATINERHTCAHRVNELMAVVAELRPAKPVSGQRVRTPVTLKRGVGVAA